MGERGFRYVKIRGVGAPPAALYRGG
jgi:hypothetical protein